MASLLQQPCRRQPRQTRTDDQNALLWLRTDRLAAKTHSRHRADTCKKFSSSLDHCNSPSDVGGSMTSAPKSPRMFQIIRRRTLTWIKASLRRTCKMAVSQNPYCGAEPGREAGSKDEGNRKCGTTPN
jgi:hypothetical protein